MRKFIFILIIFPVLALNFAPVSYSAPALSADVIANDFYISQDDKQPENRSSYFHLIAEALNEAEVEEKVIPTHFYQSLYIVPNYGYAMKDQFSIPSERFYLPDEPPIH